MTVASISRRHTHHRHAETGWPFGAASGAGVMAGTVGGVGIPTRYPTRHRPASTTGREDDGEGGGRETVGPPAGEGRAARGAGRVRARLLRVVRRRAAPRGQPAEP